MILTGVDYVYTDFGKETQTPITEMNVEKAKELIAQGQFGEGNMLPKIEAALDYLETKKDGKVIITSIANAADGLKGKTGTVIFA